MSLRDEIVRLEVELTSPKTQNELADKLKDAQIQSNNLRKELEALEKAMAVMVAQGKKETEQYKLMEKQQKSYRSALSDSNKEIKLYSAGMDKSNMSASQLRKRMLELQSTLNSMNKKADPATWSKLNQEYKETIQLYSKMRAGANETGAAWKAMGNIFAGFSLSNLAGKVLSGVKDIATGVANSTQDLSDYWAEMTTGMEHSYQSFLRTIATGDWSNLFSNMKEAYKLGKEIAKMLDELFERGNSYDISSAKVAAEIEQLYDTQKNVNLSLEERKLAGEKIIALTRKQAEVQTSIAEQELEAHKKNLDFITKMSDAEKEYFIENYNQNIENIRLAGELIEKEKELKKETNYVMAPDPNDKSKLSNREFYTEKGKLIKQEIDLLQKNFKAYEFAYDAMKKYNVANDESIKLYVDSLVKKVNITAESERSIRKVKAQDESFDKDIREKQKKDALEFTKNQKESLRVLEADLETSHQNRLTSLQKARLKENQTDAQYNVFANQEDAKYYAERIAGLEKFLATVKDKSLRADIQKKISEDHNRQLEAQRKFDQANIALVTESRDKQLKIVQDSYDKQRLVLEKKLAERKITQDQYNVLMFAVETTAADSRLKIQQCFQEDVASLEIQSGDLKAQAVEEANKAVMAADTNAAQKRGAQLEAFVNSTRDFKKSFGVLSPKEETNLQLRSLEIAYQAQKELQEAAGADTTELTRAYEQAKTNIILDAEKQRFSLRQQLGLASWTEEYDMEMANLQDLLDNKQISQEEYEKAVFNTKVAHAKKYFDYYSGLFSGAVSAIKDAELANIDTKYDAEIAAAEGNSEEIERLEQEKAQKKLDVEKKYADVQFGIKVAEITANTAVAIMTALAQLGPIAGGIAAGLMGATGLAQIAVANAEREKIKNMTLGGGASSGASQQRVVLPGKEEGGYMDVEREQDGKRFKAKKQNRAGYTDQPTVLTGEAGAEFVANTDAVANPSVKPVLDIIDLAQRSGSISSINLPAIVRVMGKESGGYISSRSSSGTSTETSPARNSPGIVGVDPEYLATMKDVRALLQYLKDNGVNAPIVLSELEKKQALVKKSISLGSRR